MKDSLILWLISVLSIAVLSLHLLALDLFLYWKVWWFDLLVHFLAGALSSLFFIWIFRKKIGKTVPTIHFLSALFTLGVGLVWEVFEYLTGLTFSSSSYALDTSLDILFTFFGGLCAVVYHLSDGAKKIRDE